MGWALRAKAHLDYARVRQMRTARHRKPWTPKEDRLLGTKPDSVVGRQLGRSAHAVLQRRHRLGIPPKSPYRRWTPQEEKLLGTMPDLQVSVRLGWDRKAVAKRRKLLGIPRCISSRLWTSREEGWLGRKTDAEIAR